MTINDGTAKWELYIVANTVDIDNAKNSVTSSINRIKVTKYTTPTGEFGDITHSLGSVSGDRDFQCKGYASVTAGVNAGTYTLQNILQQLVTKSHSHSFRREKYDCDCTCD